MAKEKKLFRLQNRNIKEEFETIYKILCMRARECSCGD